MTDLTKLVLIALSQRKTNYKKLIAKPETEAANFLRRLQKIETIFLYQNLFFIPEAIKIEFIS